MKSHHILFFLLVPALFFMVACKSTPKEAPASPPPEEAPARAAPGGPSQASRDALNAALARAEAARKRASDFESASYFPSDWENAESEYASAGQLSRNTDDGARQAAARYTALADTYDGIFTRAIPLYAQDREDEITLARDEALGTGLADIFPDYLLEADRSVAQALAQYEGEDYYAARDTWNLARDKYRALKTGGDAYNRRREIVERNFISYDPENFSTADEVGLAAVDAYGAGDIEAALNGAEEAGLRYSLVLKTAWASYAAERRDAAVLERQKALDLKANVAVKAEFDAASLIYNQAESSVGAEKYEEAAVLYIQSEARFTVLGRTAAEKRRDAEDAIREAEQKMLESEEAAKRAELILEGGES
jgi:hypothetical protein